MFDNNEKNPLPIDENPENEAADTETEQTENTAEESVDEESVTEGSVGEDQPMSEEDTAEYDEYDDIPIEDDDENFAAVAERITGARHTIAATAAPIRRRDETGRIPTLPKPTAGIPTRQADEEPEEAEPTTSVNDETKQEKSLYKRTFAVVVASAAVLIVILSAMIVSVNKSAAEKRPPDINIGETFGEADVLSPEDERENTVSTDTEESEADTDETDTDTETAEESETETEPDVTETEPAVIETETEPETETETEPETEPAPVKFTVTLDFYDKEDITVATEAITFADLLASVEYTLTDEDVPSISLDSTIAADTTISIGKREYRSETVTETIAYETEVIEVDTIPRDTTNYLQYGENGELAKTYTVEYLNGVEQNRTLAGEQTTKWPVNEKYELGVGGSFVGADGVTYTYSYRRVVPATYYNIEGLTFLGTMADESVIAVDRSYIPLGTKLYVKNDTYDFGVRIASDVGSMIKEWEIDIWIDDSNPQLDSFAQIGYHYDMEIYYID